MPGHHNATTPHRLPQQIVLLGPGLLGLSKTRIYHVRCPRVSILRAHIYLYDSISTPKATISTCTTNTTTPRYDIDDGTILQHYTARVEPHFYTHHRQAYHYSIIIRCNIDLQPDRGPNCLDHFFIENKSDRIGLI